MFEILKNILGSDFGSLGFVLSLLFLAFFIVWHASKFKEKISNMLTKNDDDKNTIKGSLSKLDSTIDAIRSDLGEIKGYISFQKNSKTGYAQSQSPLSLTDKGEETAKKLNLDAIIDRKWDKINIDVEGKLGKDSNPYDIQEICFAVGNRYSDYLNQEDMGNIKKIAFSEGVDLSAFDILFGIQIRNKYFKEHNIHIDKIDKFKP